MKKSNNRTKAIPVQFNSIEEAGDFWDKHDLSDYWERTCPIEISFSLKKKHYYVSIRPGIAKKLRRISAQRGVATEAVVNAWLQEKLLARM